MKDIFKDKIEKQNKNKSRIGVQLSFYNYPRLMMHDCFRRVRSAI
ncbi:hypothetical protein [Clostridium tyrobutyricum]|nr:hypothetical protein [Clostridium tyrobutyricum]